MKLLVTGAAGFIGAHLVKHLLAQDHQVVGIDNLNSYYSPEYKKLRLEKLVGNNPRFTFYSCDITDTRNLAQIFNENHFSTVFHLAAQAGVRYSLTHPYIYEKNNILGTLNILEQLKKSSKTKLIFASSSSVYGNSKNIPFSEKDNNLWPISLYGVSKRSNELMIKAYHELYAIKAVCARFFTVYGPWGRPDMAYFIFTKNILEDKKIEVFQLETQRDMTYIDDIIMGIDKILNSDLDFEIINLGNSSPIKLEYLVNSIEKISGKKASFTIANLPKGDVKATYADISLAKKLLGWAPTTSVYSGLEKFVSWFRKENLRQISGINF